MKKNISDNKSLITLKIIKKYWWLFIALGLALVLLLAGTFDFSRSQGSFRGRIIDYEYTGIIWKNHVFHVQRTYNDTLAFTICHDNPNQEKIVQTIKNAQTQNHEIIIQYQDRFFHWNWTCNGQATPATNAQIATN